MATDNVLTELQEDLNRDRMTAFFKKNGKTLALLAFLIVAGIAAFQIWKSYDMKSRTEAGDKLYAAISNFDQQKDAKQIVEVEKNRAYADIASLVEANYQEAHGDTAAMEKAYEKVAKSPAGNTALKQLAELNLISIKLNGNPADKTAEADLKKLSADDQVFKYTALEMLAGYYKRNGRIEEAKATYEKIANDPAAPSSLAGRSKSMLSSF